MWKWPSVPSLHYLSKHFPDNSYWLASVLIKHDMLFILSIIVLIRIKKKEKAGYTLEQGHRLLKPNYEQKQRRPTSSVQDFMAELYKPLGDVHLLYTVYVCYNIEEKNY